MSMGLTRQQAACLAFVVRYTRENGGVAPTYSEIETALDLRSRSQIHRMLKALEERGAIRRRFGQARAIEIIDDTTPDFSAMTDAGLDAAFLAALIELNRRREARA